MAGADGGALDGLSALVHVYTPSGGKVPNTSLRRLGLAGNQLGEEAAVLIAQALLQVARSLRVR